MGKAVRLSDIAKRASVSTVTVSKALSGQKGVSNAKRALIEKLAQEMGYQKTSSSAAQKKSYMIGIIVSERFLGESQSFYGAYYQEIAKAAARRGNLLSLEIVTQKEEESPAVPAMILGHQVRGILLLGTFRRKFRKAVLDAVKVPYLFLDGTEEGKDSDNIAADNLRMGYRITNYLFDMGHRRIGFVGTRNLSGAVDDRYLGYAKSLMGHGVPYQPDWILNDRDPKSGILQPEKYFQIDPENMPTAYICCSGITAYLFAQSLKRMGLSVPDDVSVAGFEDFAPDKPGGPELTCMKVDIEGAADRAIADIVQKIEGTGAPVIGGSLEVPGELIIGESVKRIGKAVEFA